MPSDSAHPLPSTHQLPQDNQPGHHPAVEQDKPSLARLRSAEARLHDPRTFDFAFDPLYRLIGRPLDIRPETTSVEVGPEDVVVRFGRWSARVERSTIDGVEVTGPYAFAKTVGTPHLSLSDRGITFATNRRRGLCLHLSRPVRCIEPLGLIRHPGITVTVDDPDGLRDLLSPS